MRELKWGLRGGLRDEERERGDLDGQRKMEEGREMGERKATSGECIVLEGWYGWYGWYGWCGWVVRCDVCPP